MTNDSSQNICDHTSRPLTGHASAALNSVTLASSSFPKRMNALRDDDVIICKEYRVISEEYANKNRRNMQRSLENQKKKNPSNDLQNLECFSGLVTIRERVWCAGTRAASKRMIATYTKKTSRV